MSDKKEEQEKKKLSREFLTKQYQETQGFVQAAQQQILSLQNQVQQNLGIAGYVKHLLDQYDLPEKIVEPKKLEVK